MKRPPRITLGLPVFNGERFLGETIESLLAQSFGDFELLIGDNASTDSTPEICERFAALDQRVRILRNPENLGASNNYNRLVDAAAGEYFKWAADDDLLAPDFLARCVALLDADDSAVIAMSEIELIDSEGRPIGPCPDDLGQLDDPEVHRRFADLILVDHRCIDVFGVVRTATLRKTQKIAPFIASDRVLLAELGLHGRFRRVPERLFYSRDHPARSINAMPALHLRAAWFDPSIRGPVFPNWRLFAEYGRVIRRAPLSAAERFRCRLQLARWPAVNLNWARMARDIVIATTGSAGPLRRRNEPS